MRSSPQVLLLLLPAAVLAAPRFGAPDAPLHWREPSSSAAPNIPRWATTYDWEMTPSHGAQNVTNLAFGNNLVALDWAWGNHSTPGLWVLPSARTPHPPVPTLRGDLVRRAD